LYAVIEHNITDENEPGLSRWGTGHRHRHEAHDGRPDRECPRRCRLPVRERLGPLRPTV